MIVADLLGQVRERLGDELSNRWSDRRLLYVATQGQIHICTIAGVLRRQAVIPLSAGKLNYKLPQDCATLKRVEYKGKYLPLYSRNDTDASLPSTYEMVAVKTNLGMEGIDIYPSIPPFLSAVTIVMGIPTDSTFTLVPMYGVIGSADAPFTVADVFGELSGLTYDMATLDPSSFYGDICDSALCTPTSVAYSNGNYGVVTEVSYGSPISSVYGLTTGTNVAEYSVVGTYGIVTDIAGEDAYIRVFYEAVPTAPLVLTSSFVIPDIWMDTLSKYIVGTALQDDNDANNIQRGEMELKKFDLAVAKARELSSKDFSAGMKDKLRTSFRRI